MVEYVNPILCSTVHNAPKCIKYIFYAFAAFQYNCEFVTTCDQVIVTHVRIQILSDRSNATGHLCRKCPPAITIHQVNITGFMRQYSFIQYFSFGLSMTMQNQSIKSKPPMWNTWRPTAGQICALHRRYRISTCRVLHSSFTHVYQLVRLYSDHFTIWKKNAWIILDIKWGLTWDQARLQNLGTACCQPGSLVATSSR